MSHHGVVQEYDVQNMCIERHNSIPRRVSNPHVASLKKPKATWACQFGGKGSHVGLIPSSEQGKEVEVVRGIAFVVGRELRN